MAILSLFSARISVDGRALKEFDADGPEDNSAAKSIVKYVQAPMDAASSIEFQQAKEYRMSFEAIGVKFVTDGNTVGGFICSKEDFGRRSRNRKLALHGMLVHDKNGAVKWPLQFSKLNYSMASTFKCQQLLLY